MSNVKDLTGLSAACSLGTHTATIGSSSYRHEYTSSCGERRSETRYNYDYLYGSFSLSATVTGMTKNADGSLTVNFSISRAFRVWRGGSNIKGSYGATARLRVRLYNTGLNEYSPAFQRDDSVTSVFGSTVSFNGLPTSGSITVPSTWLGNTSENIGLEVYGYVYSSSWASSALTALASRKTLIKHNMEGITENGITKEVKGIFVKHNGIIKEPLAVLPWEQVNK